MVKPPPLGKGGGSTDVPNLGRKGGGRDAPFRSTSPGEDGVFARGCQPHTRSHAFSCALVEQRPERDEETEEQEEEL